MSKIIAGANKILVYSGRAWYDDGRQFHTIDALGIASSARPEAEELWRNPFTREPKVQGVSRISQAKGQRSVSRSGVRTTGTVFVVFQSCFFVKQLFFFGLEWIEEKGGY